MTQKILIVASHPDDEILGCGGSAARLYKEGHEIYTLILGEGITARDEQRDKRKRETNLKRLRNQALQANRSLGIKKVFFHELPDNRFDTIPFLEIVKNIEKVIKDIRPDIVFTHYDKDLNLDHRITYQAVVTATRPLPDEPVKEIYSFEIASSTEWNYPLSFSPDVFFDIHGEIDEKIEALKKYTSETKEFPHPRSPEGIRLSAEYWGMKVGMKHVEAFKLVRMLK
jgi:LmbE family N-acetylglucosaminyl deacetylase